MKKVFILCNANDKLTSELKHSLCQRVSVLSYSVLQLPQEVLEVAGFDERMPSEINNDILYKMKTLLEEYNDSPMQDVVQLVQDYQAGYLDGYDCCLVEAVDDNDVARLVNIFNAIPIFIIQGCCTKPMKRILSISSDRVMKEIALRDGEYLCTVSGDMDEVATRIAQIVIGSKITSKRGI